MKNSIKFIAIVVVCLLVSAYAGIGAHAASLHIGPCEGQIAQTGVGKTGKGTVSAAIVLSAETLKEYAGAKITGMRFVLLTTDGMQNVRGWVRNGLTDANLDSASVAVPTTQWNEVALTKDIAITGTDSLSVGFSFEQQSTVKCFSIAGNKDDNGYWVAKNGAWSNRSASVSGSLSIELIIEGSNIAGKNLAVSLLSSDRITRLGDQFQAVCVVKNTAEAPVSGYSYTCTVGGQTAKTETVNKSLAFHETDTIALSLASDIVAKGVKIPVVLQISADGDEVAADNTAQFTMSTYDDANKTFFHKVLLEEYSTEQCPNCERGIKTIAACMEMGYDKNTVQVTHHSGYKYDFLTTADDKELEWFYGPSGSFAPGAMLDRTSLTGKTDTPVMSVGYSDTFAPYLAYATSVATYVGVTPNVSYNDVTRTLDITVNIEKDDIFDAQADSARLTVYITQDSILHHHQAGYSSNTFRHRHVYRATVTDLWGDKIEWNGNTATMHYQYQLPEAIEALHPDDGYDNTVVVEPRDISVVAFVSDYNSNDNCACKVFNSEDYSLKTGGSSGIAVASADKVATVEYYTLSGMKVNNPSNGIFLKRIVSADGSVSTIKILK